MPQWLSVLVSFAHDLATGFWLALVLVAAGLRRTLEPAGLLPAGRPVLVALFRWVIAALVVILLTGVWRTLTFRNTPGIDPLVKRRLLIAKHVLLGAAFALGTWYAWRLAFA